MLANIHRSLSGFMFIALAMALLGQTPSGQTAAARPLMPTRVQRQVYTAELKVTSVQRLADGTTITRENKEVRARDSQGRFLNTNSSFAFVSGRPGVTFTHTHVTDPVEGTQTTWDSQNKKARVIKLPPVDQRQGCWATESGNFRASYGSSSQRVAATPGVGLGAGVSAVIATIPNAAVPRPLQQSPPREDLGTATIMGIEAQGYRTTFTTPVGEVGNDKPLVRTNEFWTAPGFDFPLRQVDTDPQSGTRTTEVVSLDLSEPDPATFQPPEGYEVVIDELHEEPCQQMNRP